MLFLPNAAKTAILLDEAFFGDLSDLSTGRQVTNFVINATS